MSNTYCKLIASIVAVVSYVCALPNAATAQSQKGPLAVADNDSVFIDSKSFTITPGRAKGDVAAQIQALGARDLAAIIFRSGGKFYLIAAPLLVPGSLNVTGQ